MILTTMLQIDIEEKIADGQRKGGFIGCEKCYIIYKYP